MLSMLSNHRWEQSMHCPSMPAGPPVTQSYLDMCCRRCQQSLWNNTCSQTNKKHHGIQLRMRSLSKLTLRPNLLGPVAFKHQWLSVSTLAFKPLPPAATAAAVEELLKANFCLMESGACFQGRRSRLSFCSLGRFPNLAPRPTSANR